MDPDHVATAEDVATTLATIPERTADLVSALDSPRLDYRHAPAFPTIREVAGHLCESGTAFDGLLRHVHLDGASELPLRDALEARHEPDLSRPLPELMEAFGRVRRRTVDLLRGLSGADWARSVHDPRQGDLTVREASEQVARHEAGHLSQIRNLIALLPEA